MSDEPTTYGGQRQREIYLAGMAGRRPTIPLSPEGLEAAARAVMQRDAFDFVAGGAGGDDTIRANQSGFDRWRIVPRMLRDVSERDLSVELFGRRLPAPVLLAPIGVQTIVHEEGESASARAAAKLGLPFVLSTAGSRTMEEIAVVTGDAPRWFQLYWGNDTELTESFLARAEKSGYDAIMLTLDATSLGWRERDLQRAFLPFLHGHGLANYFSDPVFRAALRLPPEEDPEAAKLHFLHIFSNPPLTWEAVDFIKQRTRLPLILKGLLHPDDARAALDHGADGILVSNHGGRQVAGAISAVEALPGVVEAVEGRAPILFDSGIRRGADALKALALGAAAVCLGRPYIYGLALNGEEGVREVLRNFLGDLDLTLALSGHRSVAELDPSVLAPAD